MFAVLATLLSRLTAWRRPQEPVLLDYWLAWTPEEGLTLDEWQSRCEARAKRSVQTQD